MKKIYVAATQQHDGKTTMSLGLYQAARARGHTAAFIKPVGQRYLEVDGVKADEDAILFKQALGAGGGLQDLSPVTIPRGFTEHYVFHRDPQRIRRQILDAFAAVSEGNDVVVVEGTGHAGVGSVIDASNAEVAAMIDADAIIVSQGGIGRCIDEINLNLALFEKHGVRCLGAIINKVWTAKYEKIAPAVRQGLANRGIECLGVVPFCEELSFPTVRHLCDELELEVFCGGTHLDNLVRSIIVGAMEPQNMIGYLEDGCLVVVPGDRVDNIVVAVNAYMLRHLDGRPHIAGLLLTGGMVPPDSIMSILKDVDVPVLLSKEDTASAAYDSRRLVPKITPTESGKISLAAQLIAEHVDVERIFGE